MKKSRYTEDQIIGILREVDGGTAIAEVCRHRPSDEGLPDPFTYSLHLTPSGPSDKLKGVAI